MAVKGTRKLIVTGQKPITKIKMKNGGETTLFEVFATDEHGGFIEEPLRAFTELETGQCLEYEIQPYNHRRYGISYTLIPPKRETARRLRELEEAVEWILQQLEAMGKKPEPPLAFRRQDAPTPTLDEAAGAAGEAGKEGTPPEPTEPPDRPDLDEKYGEDPPWDDEPPPEGEKPPPPEEPPPGDTVL
jgi:hypothetical protein